MSDLLARRGTDLFFFETGTDHACTARINGSRDEAVIRIGNLDHSKEVSTDIRNCSVWLRNKARISIIGNKHQQATYFRMAERTAFLEGSIAAFGVDHFNDLGSSRWHDNKLVQLRLARSVGFEVPATLVSNDPAAIRDFVGSRARTISKPLRTPALPSSRDGEAPGIRLMANLVDQAEFAEVRDEELAVAPGIFQAYAEKHFEIRLLATSYEMAAYRLNSQESAAAAIDWRKDSRGFSTAPYPVPPAIRERVAAYLSAAGLSLGVFDLIVSPDGRWTFLECNSDGQWGWLEQDDGPQPMSDAVANLCLQRLREAGDEVRPKGPPGRPARTSEPALV